MSITLKVTLRSLFANKWRLMLTAFAVVLGVGFVSGSFMLRDTLRSSFTSLAKNINSGVDVQVRARNEFGQDSSPNPTRAVPASLVPTIRGIPGVAAAEGNINLLGITIVGKDGKAKVPAGAPTIGYVWVNDPNISVLKLAAGRKPIGKDELALDTKAMVEAGYRLGDTVKVVTPTSKIQATLVGTFTFGKTGGTTGAYLVAFDPAVASDVLGLKGNYQTIDIHAANGENLATLAQRISASLPKGFEAIDSVALNKETVAQFVGFTEPISNILLGFALIALFVSMFIITNTFQILASQRLRELALLRALGASSGQIRAMITLEGLAVGIFGSIFGIGFGVLIAILIKVVVGSLFGGLQGGLIFTTLPFVVGIALGIVVTLASALAPALRAARIPPVAAMSGRHQFNVGHARLRSAIAIGATVFGLALVGVGLFGRPGKTPAWISLAGLGAIMLFLGVAGLSRLLARPVITALSSALRPLARLVSWPFTVMLHRTRQQVIAPIARENVARTPRRTAAAAAALMIGIALIASGTVVGASIKTTVNKQLQTSIKADLFFSDKSFVGTPERIERSIAGVDGIAAVSGYSQMQYRIANGDKTAGVVDHSAFGELLDIKLVKGSWKDLTEDKIFLYKDPARDLKASIGTKLNVRLASVGIKTFTVAGIYNDASNVGNSVVDVSTYRKYNDTPRFDVFIGATLKAGADLATVKSATKTFLLDQAPALEVQDRKEFQKAQAQQIDLLVAIINALLFLAILIAVFGIANTLALSITERTRELGLMRAVGLLRSQTRSMIRWESVLTSVFGVVLGLGLGVALGSMLAGALPTAFVDGITIPIGQLAIYVVAGIVAGIIAAALPARRAAKMNILAAIAQS